MSHAVIFYTEERWFMYRRIYTLLTCLLLSSLTLIPTYSSEEYIVDFKKKLDAVNATFTVRKEFTSEELESFLEDLTSLDSCFSGLETTISETLRFFNFDNGNPQIAIIGGGYTGVFLCCQLANLKKADGTPALDIHLFEKNLNLMQGASTAPARLHLGGEYPKDQTTALQCLISALIFKQMLPTESILTTRKRIDFLLAKESTEKLVGDSERLTLEQLRDHYIKIHAVYSDVYTQLERGWGAETSTRLFGTPNEFFSFLDSPEKIEDERLRQHFIGGIKTSERGLQPIALGVILERLLAAKNIYLHLGHVVVGAESVAGEGYKLRHHLTTSGEEKDFFARYVVSAAWDENPYLTYQASVNRIHSATATITSSLISAQRPTKVYLRSIGLFDVSRCTGLPIDRSYFGLMGRAGAMVSFFSPTVAIIYVPEEDLSYQGRYSLQFDTERNTILDREAQVRLEELRKRARQNKVLNNMLRNVQVKYPFLRGAEPITLLTRPTLSWDDEIYQRQHIKASWPLGENSRWLQVFATKATFAPLIALQALGQITRQTDITQRVNLSAEIRGYLENICRADLENIGTLSSGEMQSLLSSIVKVPEDFVLFREILDVRDSEFLAEMQLYALKRHLPLTMIEGYLGANASIKFDDPIEQIPLIDWRNLRHVDIRSIIPTQEILETLAEVIRRLPRAQGFQSFRFQYHTGEGTVSESYAHAGQQVLEALLGGTGEERPIEELEIDGLVFTLEEEVDALTSIIMAGALEKLTLTKFSSHVPVGILLESFFLPLDRAESLKKFKLSFRGMPNIKTTKTLLRSMMVMPSLRELSASHNNIGTILGEEANPNCFKPLEDLICVQSQRTTQTLTYLDLADNELFTGSRFKLKDSFLRTIKSKLQLKVDIRKNGFHPDEEKTFEDSQMHSYLSQEIEKLKNYYRAVKAELEERIQFEKERQKIERQKWDMDPIIHFLSSIVGSIFNDVIGIGRARDNVTNSSQTALIQELRNAEERGKKQREQTVILLKEIGKGMERRERYQYISSLCEENRRKIQEKVHSGPCSKMRCNALKCLLKRHAQKGVANERIQTIKV
jgi:hypothetical protein